MALGDSVDVLEFDPFGPPFSSLVLKDGRTLQIADCFSHGEVPVGREDSTQAAVSEVSRRYSD